MARIQFRTKPSPVYNTDGTLAYEHIQVPVITRKHCDMTAFRSHPKYGPLANSDLFPNVLCRIRRDRLGDRFKLDKIPDGVTVTKETFMVLVSIDV
jgi:hypothetical protein